MIGFGLHHTSYVISAKPDMFKLHNRKGIRQIYPHNGID